MHIDKRKQIHAQGYECAYTSKLHQNYIKIASKVHQNYIKSASKVHHKCIKSASKHAQNAWLISHLHDINHSAAYRHTSIRRYIHTQTQTHGGTEIPTIIDPSATINYLSATEINNCGNLSTSAKLHQNTHKRTKHAQNTHQNTQKRTKHVVNFPPA
jgi:hypothetical protein